MSQRSPYSMDDRAKALAMIEAGMTLTQVQASTGISRRTLSYWKAEHGMSPQIDQEARAAIGTMMVDYMRTMLTALTEQQVLFADPEWLRMQDAQALAVLHGVSGDKLVRFAEALTATPEEDD